MASREPEMPAYRLDPVLAQDEVKGLPIGGHVLTTKKKPPGYIS